MRRRGPVALPVDRRIRVLRWRLTVCQPARCPSALLIARYLSPRPGYYKRAISKKRLNLENNLLPSRLRTIRKNSRFILSSRRLSPKRSFQIAVLCD